MIRDGLKTKNDKEEMSGPTVRVESGKNIDYR